MSRYSTPTPTVTAHGLGGRKAPGAPVAVPESPRVRRWKRVALALWSVVYACFAAIVLVFWWAVCDPLQLAAQQTVCGCIVGVLLVAVVGAALAKSAAWRAEWNEPMGGAR